MTVLVILLVGQAMATMDGSILVVAAPSLRVDLHASGAELQLVVAAYTLAFGALVVTGARLGDILGRRRAFMQGLAAFTAASLLGGLAPNPTVLICARALQGAAAALMTPQVLSIIQSSFEGERRARAIGAYSMILAVGVAAGQIIGGLLITAHLLAAAWRPALLLNAPIGATLLVASRRRLPSIEPTGQRLDFGGVALLAGSLVALIVPLTFGRQYHWPVWVWPCLIASLIGAYTFARYERRVAARGGNPVFDLGLLTLPGVAAGVLTVLLIMACYAGFLFMLTLHLQGALGFSAFHAGLIFAIYASGFATASLTWTRAGDTARARLPVIGPPLMGVALLAVGLIAAGGGWPTAATAPLLFVAGVGHAFGFSPLASRLTTTIAPAQAADLSGLILTASLIGQVTGVTAFVGIYLGAASHGSAYALAVTTGAIAAVLVVAGVSARCATGRSAAAHSQATSACKRGDVAYQTSSPDH
ncbi:MAG TPA: MFS transporter [Solirubrobacteraceae bacterium]